MMSSAAGTAENALAERGHHLTGIDDRFHGQALFGCRNRTR